MMVCFFPDIWNFIPLSCRFLFYALSYQKYWILALYPSQNQILSFYPEKALAPNFIAVHSYDEVGKSFQLTYSVILIIEAFLHNPS